MRRDFIAMSYRAATVRGCEKMLGLPIEAFEARSRVLRNLAQSFRAGLLRVGGLFPHLLHFNGFLGKPLKCKRWGGGSRSLQKPSPKGRG